MQASETENDVAGAESGRRGSSRLPRAQRVGDIEAAARAVFSRRGFSAASMSEIAAEAGVAEGTIYKFFESKRHLVLRVIECWYDQMLSEFDKNLHGISGARNKLRFIIWRHLTSLKENPELARLCANEVRNGGEYYQSGLHKLNRRYTFVFIEACREGIASGEFRADMPISLVRDLIFGGIDHHIVPVLYGNGEIDPQQSADLILDTVLNGIHRSGHPPVNVDDQLARIEKAAERLEQAAERLAKPL